MLHTMIFGPQTSSSSFLVTSPQSLLKPAFPGQSPCPFFLFLLLKAISPSGPISSQAGLKSARMSRAGFSQNGGKTNSHHTALYLPIP